jgi:hypothetical protein
MSLRHPLATLSCQKVLALLEGFVRRRIAATAVLAVGLVLGTAGCTFLAPTATAIQYDPSDGVSLNVGAVQVRNAFVISPKGTDANLIGVVINTGKKPLVVDFQYTTHAGGTAKVLNVFVPLPAGAVESFGNPGVPQLVFRSADAKPGALLKVFVVYSNTKGVVSVSGKNVLLPVLDGSQSYYNGLAPSPAPSPTPTITPGPTPTATN